MPQHAKTHYAYINRAVPLSLWRVFINLVAITDLSEHKDPFKISPCPATPTSLPATATATARRRRPIPTALLSPRNPTARRRPLSHTPPRPTPSRPPPTINLRRTSPTPTAAEAAVHWAKLRWCLGNDAFFFFVLLVSFTCMGNACRVLSMRIGWRGIVTFWVLIFRVTRCLFWVLTF